MIFQKLIDEKKKGCSKFMCGRLTSPIIIKREYCPKCKAELALLEKLSTIEEEIIDKITYGGIHNEFEGMLDAEVLKKSLAGITLEEK